MRYAPGKVPANLLPADPKRPGVKPTVTGAPDKNPPFDINNKPPPPMGFNKRDDPFSRSFRSSSKGLANIRQAIGGIPAGPKSALGMRGLNTMQNDPRMVKKVGTGMALMKRMGMKKGGKVSSASKRADGCAIKGKTKGKMK